MNTFYVPISASELERFKNEAVQHLNEFAIEGSKPLDNFRVEEIIFGNVFSDETMHYIEIFIIISNNSKINYLGDVTQDKVIPFIHTISKEFYNTEYGKITDYFPITRVQSNKEYYAN